MTAHSKYSPSSLGRILKCSGSAYLDPEPELEGSVYASEGTAAHELWHRSWVLGSDPADFKGTIIEEVIVTDDMIEGAQVMLRVIEQEAGRIEAGLDKVILEERIWHPDDNERGGTPDCLILGDEELVVIDYKYGAGRLVLAQDNPQLLEYATLAFEHHKIEHDNVRLIVVQPRRSNSEGNVRRHVITRKDLQAHDEGILTVQNCVNFGNVQYEVGNHCWKCPAIGNCDAIHLTAVDLDRTFSGADMDAERANEVLGNAEAIRHYLKHTEEWEHHRLKSGGEPINYQLKEKRSQRRYNLTEDELVAAAEDAGFTAEQCYKQVLLTPNQLKKQLGEEFVESVAPVTVGGTKLVPKTDESASGQKALSAKDVFADIKFD